MKHIRSEEIERLTKRTKNGTAYLAVADTLPKKDQEIEGSKPVLEGIYVMFQKLAEYEDLEEQGLLIRLPCKVGETVYTQDSEYKVYHISFHLNGYEDICKNLRFHATEKTGKLDDIWFWVDEIGKTVFFTKEEAEQALKESETE